MRKHIFPVSIFISVMTLLSCNQSGQKDSTLQSDSAQYLGAESSSYTDKVIQYNGAVEDKIRKELETFSAFTSISILAGQSIHIKDSLETVRGTQQLTDPKDSLVFLPYETSAYQAILAYKQMMTSGPVLKDRCPSLLQLNRNLEPSDSSFRILPQAGESKFLAHGNFFFLGGAPFISMVRTESNTIFTDRNGNPESRYESLITENGSYLLNSINTSGNTPTNITFGPPLNSYDSGPQEVKGIGSLVHNFITPIPAYFLTETGLIPASIISVTLKLVPEGLGCVSDQPRIEFACSMNIEEKKILGIYIPLNSANISSCSINRQGSTLWTADINADGIADVACVSSTFMGLNSDKMAEVLWFVNINGTWKIIDWGQELDCT